MKLTSKASLAFKKLKPSEKVTFGANAINGLSATPVGEESAKISVADLPVPIADLLQINDALALAVTHSKTGNHSAIAEVKNAVAEWNKAFTITANYITTIAEGDEAVIRSAGFVPTKSESTPSTKPGLPTNFKAMINGTKGAIVAGTKYAIPDAAAYIFSAVPDGVNVSFNGNTMIITAGDKTIYIAAATQRQTELYGLPSGAPYNVTTFAINRAGSGPAAPAQQVIPQ